MIGIKFSSEEEKTSVRGVRMALGIGMGELGLGGYTVSGRSDERTAWRVAVGRASGLFRAGVCGFSGERVPVTVAEITAAADAIDREFDRGTAENRMIL